MPGSGLLTFPQPRTECLRIFIRQQLERPACPAFQGCSDRPDLDAILKANREIQKLPASDADYKVIEYSFPVTIRIPAGSAGLPTNKGFNDARVNVLNAMNTTDCVKTMQGLICFEQIRKGLNVGTKPTADPSVFQKNTTPSKEYEATVTVGIIVSRTGEVYFSTGIVLYSGGGGNSTAALSLREGTVHTQSGQPATPEEIAEAIPGRSIAVSQYSLHHISSVTRALTTDENAAVSTEIGYTTQAGAGVEISVSCTGQTLVDYLNCFPH